MKAMNLAERDLSATFGALADPTRRAILAKLAKGDASVLELAEPFDMSQPAISKHLKVLERAGLIARGRDGQKRPCRLNVARFAEASRWFDHTRAAWDARFDRLEKFIAATETKDDEHDH